MNTHPLSGHRASSSSISMSTSACWIMWSFRGRGAGTSCRLPPRLCGFSKGPGDQFKILKNLHKISWAFSLYKPTRFNLYTFLMRGVIDSNPVGSDNAGFPKFPLNHLHVHVVQIWCENNARFPMSQCVTHHLPPPVLTTLEHLSSFSDLYNKIQRKLRITFKCMKQKNVE